VRERESFNVRRREIRFVDVLEKGKRRLRERRSEWKRDDCKE